ncbi:MAG TPA: hypothetical protein VGT43_08595, partial [Burkholderiales bacterium]|nr:hypothetical protein [Burkholderiales bacterium]
ELTAMATIVRIAQNLTLARARFAGAPSSRFHRERALHGILDKARLRGTSSEQKLLPGVARSGLSN